MSLCRLAIEMVHAWVDVTYLDEEEYEQMAGFADTPLGLADCASFALMERLGLAATSSCDRDFRDCARQMVPWWPPAYRLGDSPNQTSTTSVGSSTRMRVRKRYS